MKARTGGENFVALDLGASSGRAVLGRFADGRLVAEEAHRFDNAGTWVRGVMYWDALGLRREVIEGIRRAAARAGAPLAGVGVDTWGVDFGLLDRHGRLLGNPVHYRDARTDGIMDRVFAIVPREKIFALTGIQFLQFNTLFQLAAMKLDHWTELDRAHRLLMMPDLIHYFLCGAQTSEFTIATTTQLYNPSTRAWANELSAALQLSDILGPITPAGTVIGELDGEAARAAGPVPVIAPAAHDTASAVAAVPAAPGQAPGSWAYLSSGTWSLMGLEVPEPILTPAALASNFTNEGGVGGFRFLKNIAGLWFLQECRRRWLADSDDDFGYEQMEDWALCAPPFRSFIDVDHPSFLRPDNMPGAIADFCRRTGQPVPATKGDFTRVILESLALKYRMVRDALEQISGQKITRLHVIGGGSQNELLNRFTADALGIPVIAGPAEATALGNLIVQAMAAGVVRDLTEGRELIRNSFPVKTREPRAGEEWDEAYNTYQNILNKA